MNHPNTPALDLFGPRDPAVPGRQLRANINRWRNTLRQYWWWVPLIALPLGAAAWLSSVYASPRFQSEAKMWVAGRLNLAEGKVFLDDPANFLATQSELLRSRVIQERALARVIQRFPEFANRVESLFRAQIRDAAKSSILELRAIGPDPKATQLFLTGLIEEYLAFRSEKRDEASTRTLAQAQEQIRALEQELKAEQDKIHAFEQSNNVVFLQEQGNGAGSYLAGLQKQLAVLRTEYDWIERVERNGTAHLSDALANVAGGAATASLTPSPQLGLAVGGLQVEYLKGRQHLQLLEARRLEWSNVLRPAHPKMVKLSEEIATQRRILEIAERESTAQLKSRKEALRLQIENLEAAAREWDVKAVEASRKLADLEPMRQNVRRLQQNHERLLGVVHTLGLGRNIASETLALLQPASVARPMEPLARNLAVAAAASLALALAGLYFASVLSDSFHFAYDLESRLGMPVIGEIPRIARITEPALGSTHAVPREYLPFLEAFRNIRSYLVCLGDDAQCPKTLVITSSVPDEGKSTVAAHLAAVLALGGARVLLIDADLRQRALARFFGETGGPGLAEILEGKTSLAAAITPSAVANLDLLRAGSASQNPGELFLNASLQQLLREVQPHYDYILADSSPVLAVDDTTTLALRMDAALYIVRAGFTSERLIARGLAMLRQREVNILGLIFNRATPSADGHHSYSRYREYYQPLARKRVLVGG